MKFGDIRCGRTPVSEEWSESGTSGWPPFLMRPTGFRSASTEGPTDEGCYGSRRRSRSSPFRSTVARVAAYYSVKPPAVPLKLVAVAPPTPPTVPGLSTCSTTSSPPLVKGHLALAAQLDDEKCKNAVRSVLCELLTALPVSTSSSPGYHTQLPPETSASQEPHETHDLQEPRDVRASVPVKPAPGVRSKSPTLSQHARSPHRVTSPVRVKSPRTNSPAAIPEDDEISCQISPDNTAAWSVGSVASTGSVYSTMTSARMARHYAGHHVATQARSASGKGKIRPEDPERHENADEWLGGVRALRDSHVRLVLRQLRHIERLNRALDRASRGSPASPITHSVHVATSANKPA